LSERGFALIHFLVAIVLVLLSATGCRQKVRALTNENPPTAASTLADSTTRSQTPTTIPALADSAMTTKDLTYDFRPAPPDGKKVQKRTGKFHDSQGFVFAGTSSSDFGDFLLGANVGNTGKMNMMVDAGLILMIPNGTRGEVLAESKIMGTAVVGVKVTGGAHSGETVWALSEDFY
jgi:hypothetical protein